MARLIYSAVFCLFLPLVLVRMLLRSRKAPAYRQRLWERFGIVTGTLRRNGVWFHTVSVGEFLATEPLIRNFMQLHPDVPVTVTCTTPTGSEQIQKRLGQLVQHTYLPWDIPLFLYVFLWRVRPRTLVIVETELWPNLVHCSKKMGCKVLVVNARLSEKSARGYAKFSFLSKPPNSLPTSTSNLSRERVSINLSVSVPSFCLNSSKPCTTSNMALISVYQMRCASEDICTSKIFQMLVLVQTGFLPQPCFALTSARAE